MTTTLDAAHHEWATRPADERFGSLAAMHDAALGFKDNALSQIVPTRKLRVVTEGNNVKLGAQDQTIDLTNWSFGQLATLGGAPSGYLSNLPAPLAVDCLNHGLRNAHDEGEDGRDNKLLFKVEKGMATLRALNSTRYARIWNSEVTRRLLELEAGGVWQPAPEAYDGSRGLYLGDRDMFAFMVDNDRRIFESMPGGGLSRGFYCRNSEVGAAAFKLVAFKYAHICGNHYIFGAQDVSEINIRHIGSADEKWMPQLEAELKVYANSSAVEDEARIKSMTTHKLGGDIEEILDVVMGLRINGLTKKSISAGFDKAVERVDWYGDPHTVWGLAGGITEVARDLPNADARTDLEQAAGKLMEIAF